MTDRASPDDLLAALTLDEKASLTAGVGLWYLPAVERLGIPALKVSDGPSGVRGDSLVGRRSLSLPCGTAIGSTWNPELVGRLGQVVAAEARGKGVHVVLGPTVCIVRTPLAGRTFESYSEDPLLTARLAVAYVEGVQGAGVACCMKHFACNDQEHERMTISAEVDERTLREIHLPAFEAGVNQAGVWSIMTAYNRVNGVYCGEHPTLIGEILRREWAFDGLVMSDWFGTHSTGPAARAGLDLEMPGPPSWLGPSLAAAVRAGEVEEAVLDSQVRHLLGLMERVGILGPDGDPAAGQPEDQAHHPERSAVARAVATEGTVLLTNDGLLPLDLVALRRIAVIGPNANQLEAGGGSSEVTPTLRRSLSEVLTERAARAHTSVEVIYEAGCRIDREMPTIAMALVAGGVDIAYFDNPDRAGLPVATENGGAGRLTWVGQVWPGLAAGDASVQLRLSFTPDVSGEWQLGLESAGRSVLRVEDAVVVDNAEPTRGKGFFGAGSELASEWISLTAGRTYSVSIDLWPRNASSPILGVRLAAERPTAEDAFERAVAAAAGADVAVVVVGSNGLWESEGFDRPDLSLPGRQRELVEAVTAANPRTVVVINAGSPVEMPWVHKVGATLMVWYPGEEGADALADILIGAIDPSGRLPLSLPARVEDTSAYGHYPGADGEVTYGEGIFVGYRSDLPQQFPFGHGLSYATFEFGEVRVTPDPLTVWVAVTNTGERAGSTVVQVYVRSPEAALPRPDRALAGFAKVTVAPGATATAAVEVTEAAFTHWDCDEHEWRVEGGRYELLVGSSSKAIHATVAVDIAVP